MAINHENDRGLPHMSGSWQKPRRVVLSERRMTRTPNAGDAVMGLLGLVLLASLVSVATSAPRTERPHCATSVLPTTLTPASTCSPQGDAAEDRERRTPSELWAFVTVALLVAVVFLLGWTAATCAAVTAGVQSERHTSVAQVSGTRRTNAAVHRNHGTTKNDSNE